MDAESLKRPTTVTTMGDPTKSEKWQITDVQHKTHTLFSNNHRAVPLGTD